MSQICGNKANYLSKINIVSSTAFPVLLPHVTDDYRAGKRRYKWIAFLLYIQIFCANVPCCDTLDANVMPRQNTDEKIYCLWRKRVYYEVFLVYYKSNVIYQ